MPRGPPTMKHRSRPDCRRSSSQRENSIESICFPSAERSTVQARSGMRPLTVLVLAHLDQLQPRVAGEQLLVVLDVVRVGGPQAADG